MSGIGILAVLIAANQTPVAAAEEPTAEPAERTIVLHVTGMMKSKSGAT